MQKLSMLGRLSALLMISIVAIGVLVMPIPTSAAITCYEGTTRDLYLYNLQTGIPADGNDILNLQKVLNNDPDTQVWNIYGQSGYPGFESNRFGPRTEAAVIKFQKKYNITPAAGYVGSITRAKLTELYGCGGGMTAYDYNGDGVVDTLDVFHLRDVVLGDDTCPAMKVCDIDIDGQATVADILALIDYINQNKPTITVTTPATSVPSGTSYTIRWTTAPAPIKSGANIHILKDGTIIANQQFGRPQGNLSYDYNNDGVVDKNDLYVLLDVVHGNSSCPLGKVCDLDVDGGIFSNDVTILVNYILNNTALPDTGSFVWNVPASLAPGGGYQIQVIAENDASVSGISGLFTIDPPIGRILTVTKVGNGAVKSKSPLGDIDCGNICSKTYTIAKTVELEVIPDTGYRFVSWVGCVPTSNPSCSVTVNQDRNVIAKFEVIPPVSVAFSVSNVLPIPYNTNATLAWSSTNATLCTASGGIGAWPGTKTISDNQSIGPLTADTTFTLGCTGPAGTDTRNVTVTVQPPPVVALSFSAVPSDIPSGAAATLSWSAPNAISCAASGSWSGAKAITGSEPTGPLTADQTYTLQCTGPGGSDTKSATINIIPTVAVTLPSAGAQLEQGKLFTITWTTTGSTGNDFEAIVLRNGAVVTGQRFTTTSAASPRTFVWNVPPTLTAGGGYAVRVEAILDRAVQGMSGTFNIVPPPKIQVTSPNSGTEAWNIGSLTSPHNITWQSTGLAGLSVNITLKRQPGDIVVGSLTPTGAPNNQGNSINPQSNTFAWRLAENWLVAGGGYVIQICSRDLPTLCDESDAPFTILDEIPKVAFTNLTLDPQSPYTIGESVVSYIALFSNTGIRSLSGLTLAAWVEQGSASSPSAKSVVVELPLACLTQLAGTMAPGLCSSDSIGQRLFIRDGIGQFVQGQGRFVAEIKLGGSSLKPPVTRSVNVQLYPAPGITISFPNGPSSLSINRFELKKPITIRWSTKGFINQVNIKIKQADPVPLYDFNNDGAVNNHDAQTLAQLAATYSNAAPCSSAVAKNCDLDGDSQITVNDVQWLVNNILLTDPLRYVDRVDMFDFDGDGIFNAKDSDYLAQVMLRTKALSQCFAQTGKNCDVNRDGTYDVADITYLSTILLSAPPDPTIATVVQNNLSKETTYNWTPAAPFVLPAGNYKIVVCDFSRPQVCDESDETFLIFAGPPQIDAPKQGEKFFIQENMSIKIQPSHPALSLSNFRISIYQGTQLLYDNINDGGATTNNLFINNLLIRPSDGKRIIDLLREGQLRIVVSGELGGNKGFTNTAERIVQLEFDRRFPVFQSPPTPADGTQVNLGKFPIPVAATHGANPKTYELVLFQNGVDIFRQVIAAQPLPPSFLFEFTRATLQQPGNPASLSNRKVFDLLKEGPVKIILRGTLLDGSLTNQAERIIIVIPVPPDFDLNDDGDIDIEDFKILQLVVLGEQQCPAIPVPKDCDLNRDGGVNVADLATMVVHPLYQKSQQPQPTLPVVGVQFIVPVVTSPTSGATWGASDPVVIQGVVGATGYLVGFVRDQQLIHENYRDENKSLNVINKVLRTTYQVPATAVSKFTPGAMYIYVRALVNNQWTDAAVVPITVK